MENLEREIDSILGDVPVSVQIASALERMASKEHTHDYATRAEIEELKRKIDLLMDLVGDVSVSAQIALALNNIK
jgi:hypothetical protein